MNIEIKEKEYEGFRVFVPGGAVRDMLMGEDPEDIDILAVPETVSKPVEILKDRMKEISPTSSFPVFIDSQDREVALPRTEKSTGRGYKDFEVKLLVDLPVREAVERDLKRRDFTINAMAFDVQKEEIIDPYEGRQDLNDGIIRHVSQAFADDPLRVLRMARFAARFDFEVADTTMIFAKELAEDVSHLPEERIHLEMKKALKQAKSPRIFFDVLRRADVLKYAFLELEKAIETVSGPSEHHKEGSVYEHTMLVLEEMQKIRPNDYEALLAALVHDLGKIITPSDKLPEHHRHDVRGLDVVDSMADRLKMSNKEKKVMRDAVKYHHKVSKIKEMRVSTLVDFVKETQFTDLLLDLRLADCKGRAPRKDFDIKRARKKVQLVKKVFNEIDGEDVLNYHGLEKEDIGEKISGEKFGNLLRQYQIKEARYRFSKNKADNYFKGE